MAKRGRKGYEYELQQKELWNLSTDILIRALKDSKDKIEIEEKRRIALELVKKMMPSDFNIKSETITRVINADIEKMSKEQVREFLRQALDK